MPLKVLFKYFVFLLTLSNLAIYSEDWKDLEEGEKKEVYGSEKSKKYSSSNIFWEVEKWDKHYGVRILYLYDYTDYPKYNSTVFIPFYSRINSKIDNREKFRFLNYNYKIENSEISRSVFPFIFWGNDQKINQSYNATLPLYFYAQTENTSLKKTDLAIFPLTYYYSYETNTKNIFSKETHFSILHGRIIEKDKVTGSNHENSFWFPIIPLIRYTTLEDSYYHYILPIYGYSKKENQSEEETKFGFSLFPFSYSNRSYSISGKDRHYDLTHWTLFYYRSIEEDKGGFKEYTHKSIWGFPVIPFLFYSSFHQGKGNYKRILTIFHYEKSDKDELEGLSFLPFIFYKKKNYIRIPILFMDKDLSAPTAAYGRTFLPILLYYNKWSPEGQTFIFGPWVSLSSEIKKESFETVFPIYWRRKSEKQDLTMIVPFYVNYNDKENDYHFNLLWFTKSNSGPVNPSLSLGKKEEKWYFDTDFTFFYYLANISFRQTLEKPKFFRNVLNRNKSYEDLEEEKKKELSKNISKSKDDSSPKLSKKRSVSREDSFNFSGYSILFGLLSYEAADSRRHFRLLPLSWFSWDKESSDKVYVAPLFLWYQSDLLEYFVLFPFYGKQKDESSEKKVVLLNTYISESYEEGNWKEKSVVWPFVNWYASDARSGHRALPFYIQRNYKLNDSETNLNYTLFSYYRNYESKDFKSLNFFFWPLLGYYENFRFKDSERQENEPEFTNSSSLWLTPFFYNSRTKTETHTNFLWFMDWEIKNTYHPKTKTTKSSFNRLIVFPFYYFNDGNIGIFPLSFNKITENSAFTFTLFNFIKFDQNYFYWNSFLFLAEMEKSKNSLEINFLFRSFKYLNSESNFKFSGAWDYGWNFYKNDGKWQEASILWYLGAGYRRDGNQFISNLSVLFYHETDGDFYKNWTLGNYRRFSNQGLRNNFLYLIDYENFVKDNSYTWDFLFTGIRYHSLKQETYFQAGYGYIWNFRKENDLWSNATFLWLGYSKDREEVTYNFLPIIRTVDYKDEHSRIYGPLLLYTSEETGKNFHLGLLGLGYWYNKNEQKKEEDTYVLLGTIYREYRGNERGFRARGSLWGWLWDYQIEEDTIFQKFSVLKLFSYTREADGTRKILGFEL